VYERNCGPGFWYYLGIVLFFSAFLVTVLEISIVGARMKRKIFKMKKIGFCKFWKQLLHIFHCLHFPKLLYLLTIFLNTIPVLWHLKKWLPLKFQYAVASVSGD
jgi:hypothetical protein